MIGSVRAVVITAALAVVAATSLGASAEASPNTASSQFSATAQARTNCPGNPTILYPADASKPMSPRLPNGRLSHVVQAANAHGVKWLHSITCSLTDAKAAPTSSSSTNWAGSVGRSGTPYYADSRWTVPDVHGDGSSTAASLAIWNGLGGWNDTYLTQAGTESDQKTGDAQDNFFWYENLPHDPTEVRINSFGVGIGNSVEVETSWDSSVGASFYIYNFQSQRGINLRFAAHAPGPSAEFVYERPTFSNGYHPLAKFDTPQTMWSTEWDSNTAAGVYDAYQGANTLKLNMVTNGGTTLMSDSIATSGDITFTWKAFK